MFGHPFRHFWQQNLETTSGPMLWCYLQWLEVGEGLPGPDSKGCRSPGESTCINPQGFCVWFSSLVISFFFFSYEPQGLVSLCTVRTYCSASSHHRRFLKFFTAGFYRETDTVEQKDSKNQIICIS